MLILPEGITKIEEYTFSGCESLRTIVLPKSLSYLSNGANTAIATVSLI
ncbi:MAG: leucine-rich repeat domain-containing protein [Bacteroidaceae bacterium]|nr:leucine-rich repeat domain-containing protein [Bacteroidaceae bacterium]